MSFERFWTAYPKRVAKGAAVKAWQKLKPNTEMVDQIISAIESQKSWRARVDKSNSLLPRYKQKFVAMWANPSTWLNQQRWLDELDEIPQDTKRVTTGKTYCANCQKEEGKYPIAGLRYCIRCYDRKAHPENYTPALRVVK